MEIPYHLAGDLAVGERENQRVAQFEIGNYKNFVYLILDWEERKAAIVDPQFDLSAPLGCLLRNEFELVSVLLTHTHFDHMAGLPQLVKRYKSVPIYVHREDMHRIDHFVLNEGKIRPVRDGDLISIGKLNLRTIHTPGHSAGECCFFLDGNPPYLFTGDTIFIRDCGRTDLESGSNEEMFKSLQKIKKLPAETVILPGHHYQMECASTLGRELKESQPLRCKSVEELAALP